MFRFLGKMFISSFLYRCEFVFLTSNLHCVLTYLVDRRSIRNLKFWSDNDEELCWSLEVRYIIPVIFLGVNILFLHLFYVLNGIAVWSNLYKKNYKNLVCFWSSLLLDLMCYMLVSSHLYLFEFVFSTNNLYYNLTYFVNNHNK